MTRITRISVVALMMTLVASAHASETASSANTEHMQQLSWLIGEWTATIKAERTIAGVVKKGDNLLLEMSCTWGLEKNVVKSAWTVKAGDIVLLTHNGMLAWDAQKNGVVSAGADSRGKFATARWSKSGDSWQIEGVESRPEGAIVATHVVSDIQGNQFTFETTKKTQNGEPQDLNGPVVFKRVK